MIITKLETPPQKIIPHYICTIKLLLIFFFILLFVFISIGIISKLYLKMSLKLTTTYLKEMIEDYKNIS